MQRELLVVNSGSQSLLVGSELLKLAGEQCAFHASVAAVEQKQM